MFRSLITHALPDGLRSRSRSSIGSMRGGTRSTGTGGRVAAVFIALLMALGSSGAESAPAVTPHQPQSHVGIAYSIDNRSQDSDLQSAAPTARGQTLLTLSCPNSSVCYAGGNNGTILATKDAGTTWKPQITGSIDPVVSIACPTVGDCYAITTPQCESLGTRVPLLHTTDGGSNWKGESIPGCGSSLACPVATTCYANVAPTGPGGPQFVRTTDSGKSWQQRSLSDPNALGRGLACPAASACYVAFLNAVGGTTDAGKRWVINRVGSGQCHAAIGCPDLQAVACPARSVCYAGGTLYSHNGLGAGIIATKNGFRTRAAHPLRGLHGVTALSCPATNVCFALGGFSGVQAGGWTTAGDVGRIGITRNGGTSWHVRDISPSYPYNSLSCPTTRACYAAGFLGRIMGTRDGGATWHSLVPTIFVSGTYNARQPLHTYSEWFTANRPWDVSAGILPGPMGAGGRPLLATACRSTTKVTVYVRNTKNALVAGPIPVPNLQQMGGSVRGRTLHVTGKLRLDVVAHCSSFSVRIDGVGMTRS